MTEATALAAWNVVCTVFSSLCLQSNVCDSACVFFHFFCVRGEADKRASLDHARVDLPVLHDDFEVVAVGQHVQVFQRVPVRQDQIRTRSHQIGGYFRADEMSWRLTAIKVSRRL